eukprot:NODE_5184_length_422_cov_93.217158_g4510_i0.p1 GENE.NODE_5184_length_422_cov_93.217158_g4510_i0~~NODE_5184_length_422_cov_93.217158_g4510_i0.p1  ORF type:complete len:73 (+),score=6.52 NODE_5184_length_422_cov_93.217158_g4510_i0:200-418(+)
MRDKVTHVWSSQWVHVGHTTKELFVSTCNAVYTAIAPTCYALAKQRISERPYVHTGTIYTICLPLIPPCTLR